MVALVSAETVVLVLLLVLVAGLLRSHAEILRRLGPSEDVAGQHLRGSSTAPAVPPPGSHRRRGETHAPAIAGATPGGDAMRIDFAGAASEPTLLAFLTSGCSTCLSFWQTLGEPRLPSGVRIVILTRGAERERPSRLRAMAPAGVPVVMSSPAWEDYRVPGAPYFVLVDGGIRGEGVATSWQALASLVGDAIEDEHEHADLPGGTRRALEVDSTLAAGGIGPDHPSLYPARANGTDRG